VSCEHVSVHQVRLHCIIFNVISSLQILNSFLPVILVHRADRNSSGCRNGLTNPSDEESSLRDLLAMDGMLLVGVAGMDDASKLSFVRHCVDADNWARNGKKRKVVAIMAVPDASVGLGSAVQSASSVAVSSGEDGPSSAKTTTDGSSFVFPGKFRILVPGVDGARAADSLVGQSFVIAGTFPEAGSSDELGVANVKAMIQSFGGDVITRFSKKSSECNTPLGYFDVLRIIISNRRAYVCIYFG
jgi:hypothetical protein